MAIPSLIVFPHEWDKCVGWGQEAGRCEETIQNSSNDWVPFEGKLKRQKGNLSLVFCQDQRMGGFLSPSRGEVDL